MVDRDRGINSLTRKGSDYMYCSECGHENESAANFCSMCATPIISLVNNESESILPGQNLDESSKNKLDQNKILNMLDWAYDKAVNGFPGLDSAEELAEDYLKEKGTLIEKVNRLIRWQNTKCATSGFITNLGGIITLPVAIPANISSVVYVQIRMIAAIAYIGGYDVKNDRVKSLVYTCLLGNSAKDIFKECGIKVGNKFAQQAIKNMSGQLIIKINQKVGFRLLTKFGEKGLINIGKCIPVVGGLIGATLDGFATNTIGDVARETFISIG